MTAPGIAVLVVDDDDDIRDVLESNLVAAGFVVVQAADGMAALNALAPAAGRMIDVMLCDIQMPRMSGIEVIQKLRAGGSKLPIVAMTGYGPAWLDAARSAGADDTVTKPIEMPALIRMLRRVARGGP